MPKKFMQKIHMIQEQLQAQKKQLPKKEKIYDFSIEENLSVNLKLLEAIFVKNSDIIFREFKVGPEEVDAFSINIDGLSDKSMINNDILHPLMWESRKVNWQGDYSIENITKSLVNFVEAKTVANIDDVVNAVLSGETAVFIAGSTECLLCSTRKWEQRGVGQPESESVVRGPREGFTETLRINTSLVRRKIKDPELMIEMLMLGERTRTDIALVYIKDIANDDIVKEVKERVSSIKIDSILESGYIESFIEDTPFTLFPTVGYTESPDKFAGKILEGRVGVLVDGTPFALTIPLLFVENIQVTEDYYQNPFLATALRFLRIVAMFLAIFLPALYIAVINFHPNILPIALLDTVAAAQEGVPFPTAVETLLLLIFYEGLREAGVRIPRPIGQAVSIVGALVLGDAAVSAGLASYPVVIVVALCGIMGFLLPPQLEPVLLLRIPILVISSIVGLFGLSFCFVIMLIHMYSLRSFGVSYLQPVVLYVNNKVHDSAIRNPWWTMIKRPFMLSPKNSQRMKKGQEPENPENKNGESKDEKKS